jgi:hypothetical protein
VRAEQSSAPEEDRNRRARESNGGGIPGLVTLAGLCGRKKQAASTENFGARKATTIVVKRTRAIRIGE